MTQEESIKQILTELGADVCGIGAIERFKDAPAGFSPKDIFADCASVIAFGIALPKGLALVNPRLIYAHFNGDILCAKLDTIALSAAKRIERDFSCTAVPLPSDAPNEYWDKDTMTAKGLISMKHAAVYCGLGQLGKNTLLINSECGNLLTVGAILTNLPLESDPLCSNLCIPSCTACIDNCPVHAIECGTVNQEYCRKHTYGKTARGFNTVDCNTCRTVCPMKFGKKKID